MDGGAIELSLRKELLLDRPAAAEGVSVRTRDGKIIHVRCSTRGGVNLQSHHRLTSSDVNLLFSFSFVFLNVNFQKIINAYQESHARVLFPYYDRSF